MAKYLVGIREIHIQYIEVETDSDSEVSVEDMEYAKEKALHGDGEEKELDYHDTADDPIYIIIPLTDPNVIQSPNIEKCGGCDNPAKNNHPCPYKQYICAQGISINTEEFCNCCDDCEHVCSKAII